MLIRTGVSRGRTLVITEIERCEFPPPYKHRPVLSITSHRGPKQYTFRIQSDGIIHRGRTSLGTWGRIDIYSFVVITHPSTCSLFFIDQPRTAAPRWAQEYEGFWDDDMDEAIGISPKLSEVQPPEDPPEPRERADLKVCEIGTYFGGDATPVIVQTLLDNKYRVEQMTWYEYHRGSYPWKKGGRTTTPASTM